MGAQRAYSAGAVMRAATLALLLQCAVLAIAVWPAAGEVGHSGVEEMIEDYDTNASGGLDASELSALLAALVDDEGARGDCPDAATLLSASDADASGELNGEELEHAASELIPCLASLQTIESMHVTVEGTEYVCRPPGGEHDEHGHRRRIAVTAPATAQSPLQRLRRLAVPDVDAGGSEWECVAEEEEAVESDRLSTGTVWAFSLIASVVSSLCAVAGIVFMLPVVSTLRSYGDDIAACAMGALLSGVFLHMLPEAVAELGGFTWGLGVLLLAGFLFSYMLEHAVHVSREGVEAVVDKDCLDTEEHVAHHGHHIPQVSMDDAALGGVLSPKVPGLVNADNEDESKSAAGDADCGCDPAAVPDCDRTSPCSGCEAVDATAAPATTAVVVDVAPADAAVVDVAPAAGDDPAASAADATPPLSDAHQALGNGDTAVQSTNNPMSAGGAPAAELKQLPTTPPRSTQDLHSEALALAQHAHGHKLSPERSMNGSHSHGHSHVHSHAHSHAHGHSHAAAKYAVDGGSEVSLKTLMPMVYVISIGDFVHNMVDGIVIGAAFMGCDASLGWAVMLAVILHELPQELGDYVLLRHSGLSNKYALLLNLLSATGSLLGVVVVVGIGSSALDLVGYFLAFGAGVLTFIAASDILPPLMHERQPKRAAIRFVIVVVSITIVALTLLHDVHCESGEGGGDDGHGH